MWRRLIQRGRRVLFQVMSISCTLVILGVLFFMGDDDISFFLFWQSRPFVESRIIQTVSKTVTTTLLNSNSNSVAQPDTNVTSDPSWSLIVDWLAPYGVDFSAITAERLAVLNQAYSLLGVPYEQDHSEMKDLSKKPSVLDCSAFVWRSYAQAGLNMSGFPEVTVDYPSSTAVARIPWSQLKPADLLRKNGHVAMFLGVKDGVVYTVEARHTGVLSAVVSRSIGKFNTSENTSVTGQFEGYCYQLFSKTTDTTIEVGSMSEMEQYLCESAGENVPNENPSCRSYTFTVENYELIRSVNTINYKLSHGVGYNTSTDYLTGIRVCSGRYLIAIGSGYGMPGDKIDLVMENGKVLRCIVGDGKSDAHTDPTHRFHVGGMDHGVYYPGDGSVAEFIIDPSVFYTVSPSRYSAKGVLGLDKQLKIVKVVKIPENL